MRNWLLCLAFLAGCGPGPSRARALGPEWAPLQLVVKAPGPRGWVRTEGHVVYTVDPDELMDLDPVERDSLLAHEKLHAQRQLAYGLHQYLVRYSQDVAFRREEELDGVAEQLRFQKRHGRIPNPYTFAGHLIGYQPTLNLDFNTALTWCAEEIAK